MYKRYISLLLEYSSAFLVMLTPIWNLTFVLAQLKLFLEMKVQRRKYSAHAFHIGRGVHIQPFSIQNSY